MEVQAKAECKCGNIVEALRMKRDNVYFEEIVSFMPVICDKCGKEINVITWGSKEYWLSKN
ncbi:MAG: hypothetical protein E6590_17655 [Clostridiales bacterium]|nr:hypothetical protein [Clostridiales bacterium]MDU6361759.1 hypothetical protein [Clostridiales bacterium]